MDSKPDHVDPAEPVAPVRTQWATVATSALATLLVASELSMAAFTLPLIGRDLGVGGGVTAWVLLAYQLPLAALALPAGRWVDRVDTRLVFTLSLVALSVAGVLAGTASSFWVLILARALQGSAAAAYLAVYLPVVSAAVRPRQRGRAMGYHSTIMMVGSVAIAPLGGWLADGFGWRAVFFARLPLLLAAAVLGWFTVPATRSARSAGARRPRLDRALLADVLLVGAAVTAGLLALEHSGRYPVLAAVLVVAAVGLALWWVHLPSSGAITSLIRRRTVGLTTLALLCNSSLIGIVAFSLPFLISDVLQRGAALLGTAVALMVVVGSMVTPLAGALADRFTPLAIATAGGVLTALATLSFATLDAGAGWLELGCRMAALGAGMALFSSPTMTAILAAAPDGHAGATGGITNLARTLGQTVGPALAALGWSAAAGGLIGFRVGILAMAALSLAGLMALVAVRGAGIRARKGVHVRYAA